MLTSFFFDLRFYEFAGYLRNFDFGLIHSMKPPPTDLSFPGIETGDFRKVGEMAKLIWPVAYGALISDAQINFMIGRMYDPVTIQREIKKEGIRYHWIFEKSERIGFLAFGPLAKAASCTLHKLYLLPERQGRGAGSTALRWITSQTKQVGASAIHLRVNRGNRDAIRCYEGNGFKITGEDCLEIGEGFVMDDYLMRKDLEAR